MTVAAIDPTQAQMVDGDVLLEVTGLSVSFGGVVAVNSVDLRIRQGSLHGIIGPNGAGKSTLIDAITGFESPSAGSI